MGDSSTKDSSLMAIAVGAAVIVTALGFFFWSDSSKTSSVASSTPLFVADESSSLVHTTPGVDTWYMSEKLHFAFRLPDGFMAPEAKTVNVPGAQAVDVHNKSGDELLILALPVHNKTSDMVTAGDVRANSPGETITNVQFGTAASSLPGLSFDTDAKQWGGDGVAFWFIHGDYLFEISTFRKNEALLSFVRKTWQFSPPQPPAPSRTGLTL